MSASNSLRFEGRPPAKVNLTLEVLGTRPDGYHDLRSIFLRVGLTDRLTVVPGGADGSDRLTVTGIGDAPIRNNLVARAFDAVRLGAQIRLPALDATLEKRIPAAAGLGGGSSDCASAIKLAQACWGIGLSAEQELSIGAELGSDVPFFLSDASAALVEGRGERVTPLGEVANVGLLLVTPPFAMSTAQVFARYDELGREHGPHTIGEPDMFQLVERVDLLRDANDLWPAAASLAWSLPIAREELEAATGRPWLMSGSGPTLFALYPSVTEAAEAGQALVSSRMPSLDNAVINAVDLVGPEPEWRSP